MKAPLILAIAPLEQSYTELYSILQGIHEQPNQESEVKANQMREILITILRCEAAGSEKAIKVYESIQNLVKLYPRNAKDGENFICPISLEPIDLEKPEENFYSSVSSYIFKKDSISGWFEEQPHERIDPMNRRPFSLHELHVLRPNLEDLLMSRLQNNAALLNHFRARHEQLIALQNSPERVIQRRSDIGFCIYGTALLIIALTAFELSDRRPEVPVVILSVGSMIGLLGIVFANNQDLQNRRAATAQRLRFQADQGMVQQDETTPLLMPRQTV